MRGPNRRASSSVVGAGELLDGVRCRASARRAARAVADAPDRRHRLGAHGRRSTSRAGEPGDAAGLGEARWPSSPAAWSRRCRRRTTGRSPSTPAPGVARRSASGSAVRAPTNASSQPHTSTTTSGATAAPPSPRPTPRRRRGGRRAGTRRRGIAGRPCAAACPSARRTPAPRRTPWRRPGAAASGRRRRRRRPAGRRARAGAAPRPRRGTGRGRRAGSTPTAPCRADGVAGGRPILRSDLSRYRSAPRSRPDCGGCRTRCPPGRPARTTRCRDRARDIGDTVAPSAISRATSVSRRPARGRRSKCTRFFASTCLRAPR